MSKLKYTKKIEAYLSGELSDYDKRIFEKELTNNFELKEEYESVIAADKLMDIFASGKQMELIKAPQKERKIYFSTRKTLLYAASVLLIISASTFWFANANLSNTQLALSNYNNNKPNLNLIRTQTNNNNQSQEILDNAITAYYTSNFEKTIRLLDSTSIKSNNLDVTFILGCSNFELGKIDKAIEAFKKVSESETTHLRSQRSEWYLSLAYIYNDDLSAAIDILNDISNNDQQIFKTEAKKLKNDLSRFLRKFTF